MRILDVLWVALACYSLQDVQTAFQVGKREGACMKHCSADNMGYVYNRKAKKCSCLIPQEEDDVYEPQLHLSDGLRDITLTGGSRSDNDPPPKPDSDMSPLFSEKKWSVTGGYSTKAP